MSILPPHSPAYGVDAHAQSFKTVLSVQQSDVPRVVQPRRARKPQMPCLQAGLEIQRGYLKASRHQNHVYGF